MSPSAPYRLRVLVPAFLVLVTFVAIGGMLVDRLSSAKSEERDEARRALGVPMYQLANTLSELLPRELVEQADRALVDQSLDSRIEMLLLADETGTIVLASQREWRGQPVSSVPGFHPATARAVQVEGHGYTIKEDGATLRGYYPVNMGLRPGEIRESRMGVLFVVYDTTPLVSRASRQVQRQALRACLLWICCALVLSLLLHHFITRRVERLSTAMSRVAAGDLNARVGIQGHDEIARLAQAFDRMAEQLAANQKDLQLARFAMERAGDSIFWVRRDSTIVDANEAASLSLGYARNELVGMSVGDIDPDFPMEHWDEHWKKLQEGKPLHFESHQVARDGRVFNTDVTANLISFEGIELNCAFVRDLTERKKAEAEQRRLEVELLHAQRLESLGRLAGGVAHDINNVLAAVLGVASLLKARYADEPDLAGNLALVEAAASRGRNLVKGLTEFARKELEQVQVLDLNELVRKELSLFQCTTMQRIDIETDLASGPLPVLGESTSLGGALMNLCLNALDAMPDGGRLSVSTRRTDDGHAALTVEDTGHGMPEEVQRRALEPFFTTKPAGKGTGLGLAMVYGTVQAHGGSLELVSRPGEGTRITLLLPCSHAEAVPTEEEPPPTTAAESRAVRILLVDDEEMIRQAIPAMLTFLGHQVETAPSGSAALELLERGLDVDVVILDQSMPGLTGAQTVPGILERRPGMKLLMASGFRDPSMERLLDETPGVGLILKPFRMDDLRRALAPLLHED